MIKKKSFYFQFLSLNYPKNLIKTINNLVIINFPLYHTPCKEKYVAYTKTNFSTWYQTVNNLRSIPVLTLIYGDSDYLKFRTTSILKGLEDIPHVSLSSKINTDDFRTIAQTNSLFDSGSFYTIEESDSKSLQQLLKLLSSLSSDSNKICFILKDKVDKTSEKLLDASLVKVFSIGCFTPYENDIPLFIDFCTKQYGISISHQSKSYIISSLGVDLALIDNEIKKLSMIHPNSGTSVVSISDQEVQKYLSVQKKDFIFKLKDLLLQKNVSGVLLLLEDLLAQGQASLSILGYLAKHFRTLYKVKLLQEQNANQSQIASELRMSPYMLKDYIRYSPYFSKDLCTVVLKKIAEIDINLKTNSVNEYNQLAELIDTYEQNLS